MWRKALKNNIIKKRGRTLTLMAVSTGDESVKSISLPILWVYVLFASLIGVGILVVSSYLNLTANVARSYVDSTNKDSYIAQLSKENAVLSNFNRENEKKLFEMKDKLAQIESDLVYLDSLGGEITKIVKGAKSSSGSILPSRGNYEREALSSRGAEPQRIIPLVNSSAQELYSSDQIKMFSEAVDWLDNLQQSAGELRVQLDSIKKSAVSYREKLDHTPRGMPTKGRVTSRFGSRRHPITGRIQVHQGVDLAAPTGTPIVATANGTVTFSGTRAGYGRTVIIRHGFGFETLYGHTSKIIVRAGESVKHGQVIAYVGSSGVGTGSHLHYEVHVSGRPVDPWPYMN